MSNVVAPIFENDYVTIYCGDNRQIIPMLPTVDCVLTDPPFGEKTHAGARTLKKQSSGSRILINDVPLIQFDAISLDALIQCYDLLSTKTRRWLIAFSEWRYVHAIEQYYSQPYSGFRFIRHGIWNKPNGIPQISGDRPSTGWESIIMLHQRSWRGMMKWNGGGKRSVYQSVPLSLSPHHRRHRLLRRSTNAVYTAYNESHPAKRARHPTQKPLKLCEQLIADFTMLGETILDPFAGSGSFIEAAINLGRRAIAIELDPVHAQTIIDRVKYLQPPPMADVTPLKQTCLL